MYVFRIVGIILQSTNTTVLKASSRVQFSSPWTLSNIYDVCCPFFQNRCISVKRRLIALLANSAFFSQIEYIGQEFDRKTKLGFMTREEDQRIRFGHPSDRDDACGIRNGQIKLAGWASRKTWPITDNNCLDPAELLSPHFSSPRSKLSLPLFYTNEFTPLSLLRWVYQLFLVRNLFITTTYPACYHGRRVLIQRLASAEGSGSSNAVRLHNLLPWGKPVCSFLLQFSHCWRFLQGQSSLWWRRFVPSRSFCIDSGDKVWLRN